MRVRRGMPQKHTPELELSSDPDNVPPRSRLFIVVPKLCEPQQIQVRAGGGRSSSAGRGREATAEQRSSAAARTHRQQAASGDAVDAAEARRPMADRWCCADTATTGALQDDLGQFPELEYCKTDLAASRGVVFCKFSKSSSALKALEAIAERGNVSGARMPGGREHESQHPTGGQHCSFSPVLSGRGLRCTAASPHVVVVRAEGGGVHRQGDARRAQDQAQPARRHGARPHVRHAAGARGGADHHAAPPGLAWGQRCCWRGARGGHRPSSSKGEHEGARWWASCPHLDARWAATASQSRLDYGALNGMDPLKLQMGTGERASC